MITKIFQTVILISFITLTSFGSDLSVHKFREDNIFICSNVIVLAQPTHFIRNVILIRSGGNLSLIRDLYIEDSLLYIGKGGKISFSPGVNLSLISSWTIIDDNFNVKITSSDPIDQFQQYLQKLNLRIAKQ